MDYALLQARVVAFLIEAGTMLLLSLAGLLVSPEFQALVTTHFGESMGASLALLCFSGIAKHIRNLVAIKEAEHSMGALAEQRDVVVLV